MTGDAVYQGQTAVLLRMQWGPFKMLSITVQQQRFNVTQTQPFEPEPQSLSASGWLGQLRDAWDCAWDCLGSGMFGTLKAV